MKSDGVREAELPEAPSDVVPSGHALAVVSRWLPPLADGEVDDLESGPPERLRPARCVLQLDGTPALTPRSLGLGAEFLSHAKATALLDPLQRRLGRQLGGAQAKRLREEGRAPAAGGGAGGARQELPPEPEPEEAAEETRGGAFVLQQRPSQAQPSKLSRKARKRMRENTLLRPEPRR